MPLVQVEATEFALNKKEQDSLMFRISNAVLKAERAPVTDAGAQALAWAYYNERPKGSIYVGGENLDQTPLRIAVTTPDGALNDDTRAELVAEIGEIVDDIVGPYDDRLNHWTMLYDLAEKHWSGNGQIFPLAAIQEAMGIKVVKAA
jgi:phenylpyruvate tautomerase PptA (4-oxalocrotonate tautomerase family)